MEPEMAHALAKNAGKFLPTPLVSRWTRQTSPRLTTEFGGIQLQNPIGLAAGFDKNGEMLPLIKSLGFGFMEVGSVTREAVEGNPKPRVFRLPRDESLINRLGLPNKGVKATIAKLNHDKTNLPYGINIAKTPQASHGIREQIETLELCQKNGFYVVFNLSCPNTKDGRTFEDPKQFKELAQAIRDKRKSLKDTRPYLIKLSPDLNKSSTQKLVEIASPDFDGFVLGNTSLQLSHLRTSDDLLVKIGSGGISGGALKIKADLLLQNVYEVTRGQKTLIACGGIMNIENLLERFSHGADLVQIYTGLIYRGPLFIVKLLRQLDGHLRKRGMSHFKELLI